MNGVNRLDLLFRIGALSRPSYLLWKKLIPTLVVGAVLLSSVALGQTKEEKAILAWEFPNQKRGESFQKSETAEITLFVRQKFGDATDFRAVFEVVGPDGKKYVFSTVADGDAAEAVFPDNFEPSAFGDGRFTWQCYVNGVVKVRGEFEYRFTEDLRKKKHGRTR